MASSDDVSEHRSIVKYCVKRGMTPGQTIEEMSSTKNYSPVSRRLICKWHRCYSRGWEKSGTKKKKADQRS